MNTQELAILDEIKDRVQLLQELPKEMTHGTPEERMAMTKEFWTEVGELINMDTPLLLTAILEKEGSKNLAYKERNQMVLFLTKLFPSWLGRHPDEEEWEDDWRWIVFMETPDGKQMSWHIHDSEHELFQGLPRSAPKWDGHTMDEKYERLHAVDVSKIKPQDYDS